MNRSDSANAALKRIALCARSESIYFMLAMARKLKAEYGATIHLYCFGRQELVTYRKLDSDGIFETIVDGNHLLSRCFDAPLNQDEVFARASAFEDLTGQTINRMMVPDRHFGRGFCLGGYYHPRSRQSDRTSYTQVIHAYCESLSFWQREFSEKQITACLNGPREAAIMAGAAGIPYRVLIGSRYRNLHCWAHNDLYENPAIEQRWHELDETAGIDMDAPYDAHIASRTSYKARFGLGTMVRNLFRTTLQYGYWHLRRYEKARGYFYWSTVVYHYRMWREYQRLAKLSRSKLADLDNKRFVYFPLHVEPETALHGLSPEYFYQQALIAAVARDLPVGVYLVVKEAYGSIGRRPANFYDQIADLKNVILLDVWERGFDCARKADAVVTICGTAGLEAAVAGTPTIAFGQHNVYNFLPSIQVVTDERNLKHYLKEALFDPEIGKRTKQEARRLLQSIVDCSFDMGNYDYIKLSDFEQVSVESACRSLAESLEMALATKPRREAV